MKILHRSAGKVLLETAVNSLSGANLSGAELGDVNLRGTDLSGADVSYANLSGADLSGACLSGADLNGAKLSGASLNGTNLKDACLSGADLSRTDLNRASLINASLDGTNLKGASLWGTIGNSKEIVTLQTPKYPVNITEDIIQIGCENYPHHAWYSFTDKEIEELEGFKALSFWSSYKSLIFELIRNNFGKSYSNN